MLQEVMREEVIRGYERRGYKRSRERIKGYKGREEEIMRTIAPGRAGASVSSSGINRGIEMRSAVFAMISASNPP